MGLSAWKAYGPDRWALRCNPSSGNLHPTEGYIISDGVPGLVDGVHHYVSRDHVLERRSAVQWPHAGPAGVGSSGALWLALSSVHWREAWKYGERAYRYCQHDVGHALGAIAYAAAVLGWTVRLVDGCDDSKIACLLGLDRAQDYGRAEREHPDLLLAILPATAGDPAQDEAAERRVPCAQTPEWSGHANVLDPHPMYHWPVIDEVATAARKEGAAARLQAAQGVDVPGTPRAVLVIQGRRSAQRFDRGFTMTDGDFYRLLESLMPRQTLPWHLWRYQPRVHPIVFVHRVAGLDPGLYALPRHPDMEKSLPDHLHKELLWRRVVQAPADLPLYQLFPGDFRQVARTISCHQGIAGDSAFSLGMLAELGAVVREQPWRYRQLFWEAGLLGQVLYLQVESMGLAGTGIGCYFDDPFHHLLGLTGDALQSLYHFTVGRALPDVRIRTEPPYPSLAKGTSSDSKIRPRVA
jgi:SagB-type dehydrogenase family enzyme